MELSESGVYAIRGACFCHRNAGPPGRSSIGANSGLLNLLESGL
jgi:hypothetical protein